jgi:hypothetical protein
VRSQVGRVIMALGTQTNNVAEYAGLMIGLEVFKTRCALYHIVLLGILFLGNLVSCTLASTV